MQKNKYSRSSFDDFLKDEGVFEEVKAPAQKRWEELQTEDPDNTSEITGDSPDRFVRFF